MEFAPLSESKLWWGIVLFVYDHSHEKLIADHPDAKMEIGLIRSTILQIWQLVENLKEENGKGAKLVQITETAETETKILYKYVAGRALYAGLLKLFSSVCKELRDSLQENTDQTDQEAELQSEPPYLNYLLKRKRMLRKLFQETRDPKLKTEINWVSKTIRRIVRKRSL
jgi:hypothetical protein